MASLDVATTKIYFSMTLLVQSRATTLSLDTDIPGYIHIPDHILGHSLLAGRNSVDRNPGPHNLLAGFRNRPCHNLGCIAGDTCKEK